MIYSWFFFNTQHAVCVDWGSLILPNTQLTYTSKQTFVQSCLTSKIILRWSGSKGRKKTSYSASYLENLHWIYRKSVISLVEIIEQICATISHNCVELIVGKIFLNEMQLHRYWETALKFAVKEPRTKRTI